MLNPVENWERQAQNSNTRLGNMESLVTLPYFPFFLFLSVYLEPIL